MNKTISKLRTLQADSLVLFVKIHNYHWNIKWMNFFQIHQYTEKLYDEVNEIYDWLAERIIQKWDFPFVTIKQCLENAKVQEDNNTSIDEKYVLENVIKELKYLLESFKELSEIADEEDDTTTEMYADDMVAKLEKKLWMLESIIK